MKQDTKDLLQRSATMLEDILESSAYQGVHRSNVNWLIYDIQRKLHENKDKNK